MARKKKGNPSTKSNPHSGQGSALKQQKMWEEIQAKREANRKQQIRKTVIISIVAVLVIALIAGGIWWGAVRHKSKSSSSTPTVITGLMPAEAASQKDVEKTEGFLVGPDGLWSYTKGKPTIEVYVSYACPGCLSVEHNFGQEFLQLAQDGKINLIYHPVSTHPVKWEGVATDAALKVLQNDPDHFLEFHQALMDKGYEIMYANEETLQEQGNSGDMADLNKSLEIVKTVAAGVGVEQSVIDSFAAVESSSLPIQQWSQDWVAALQKKLPSISAGTPSFFRDGNEKIDTNNWTDASAIEKSLVNG